MVILTWLESQTISQIGRAGACGRAAKQVLSRKETTRQAAVGYRGRIGRLGQSETEDCSVKEGAGDARDERCSDVCRTASAESWKFSIFLPGQRGGALLGTFAGRTRGKRHEWVEDVGGVSSGRYSLVS